MKIAPPIADCVAVLTKEFPVEDIWLLEAGQSVEWALEKPRNLLVIVPDDADAHVLNAKAGELLRQRLGETDIDVHVFPQSAIARMPRPLLVKMALTGGRNIYSR